VIVSHRPAFPLRPYVRYYYGLTCAIGGVEQLQPVPARSPQIIEFMFGTPYRVQRLHLGTTEVAHSIALVGAKTHRHVNLLLTGKVDAFTVAFEPAGFVSLFSMPAEDLTDADVDATSALGRTMDDLWQRLAQAGSFSSRVAVADVFFSARCPDFLAPSAIRRAARIMQACNGAVRIDGLAKRLDMSTRQFQRRFRSDIGITPRLYARIVRFEAALRRKAAARQPPWTEVAHSLGYFDQMHMIHDFKQLSGNTPTGIADHLDMFVAPEVALRVAQLHD
jgi:AraC-like DNA-binding protein